MINKKSIENRIRGWFPQEPCSSSPQKTKIVERHLQIKKSAITRLAVTSIVTFAAEFGILSMLYILGLGYYADFAGGATAALVIVVLSVLLSKTSRMPQKKQETSEEAIR
jgi:hypothetical protein